MQLSGYTSAASSRLDATFAALADPTRRALLARLIDGEASVTAVAEPFDMSQPAISRHLKVLERAGLVTRGREAQRRPVKVETKPLVEAASWIETYKRTLERRFQRLDALLDELQATPRRTLPFANRRGGPRRTPGPSSRRGPVCRLGFPRPQPPAPRRTTTRRRPRRTHST